ncbi:uncharacterized protein [Asterias amurensis]|uniref:uncharacterized protein isoform X2 n=1 Tax=Asterias amurensis TaxID=7602 RepID=UPI003AB1DBA8
MRVAFIVQPNSYGFKMYAVVVFTETNEVELVPTNWLSRSTDTVMWPPFRSSATLTKATRERLRPEVDTWLLFKIRLLCTTQSYEVGRQKVRMAEDTSDVQTAQEETQPSKRKRRRPTSWTSSDESEGDEVVRQPKRATREAPPLQDAPSIPLHVGSKLLMSRQGENRPVTPREVPNAGTMMTLLKAISEVQVAV